MLINHSAHYIKAQHLNEIKVLKSSKVLKTTKVTESKDSKSWNLLNPYPKSKDTALGLVSGLNKTLGSILSALLNYESWYPNRNIYPSQSTIARLTKLHRVTVNKGIKKLESLGLIAKLNRGAHKPCWYKTSSFFKERHVAGLLASRLTFFFYLSVNMLQSTISEATTLHTKEYNLLYSADVYKSRSLISKEVIKRVFKPQVEVNERLTSLKLKLNLEQQQNLSRYPDEVLRKAIQVLHTRSPRDPIKLLFWLCRSIDQHPDMFEAKNAYSKPLARHSNRSCQCEDRLNKSHVCNAYIGATDRYIRTVINRSSSVDRYNSNNANSKSLSNQENTLKGKADSNSPFSNRNLQSKFNQTPPIIFDSETRARRLASLQDNPTTSDFFNIIKQHLVS